MAVDAGAQVVTYTCTDDTFTDCTIKKNQPFQATNDAADPSTPVDKWRLYLDGAPFMEVPEEPAVEPIYDFGSGLGQVGDHVMFAEAISVTYDATGQPTETASGPSNTVTVHIIAGNPAAPKHHRIK